jgi:hypothetical protein
MSVARLNADVRGWREAAGARSTCMSGEYRTSSETIDIADSCRSNSPISASALLKRAPESGWAALGHDRTFGREPQRAEERLSVQQVPSVWCYQLSPPSLPSIIWIVIGAIMFRPLRFLLGGLLMPRSVGLLRLS